MLFLFAKLCVIFGCKATRSTCNTENELRSAAALLLTLKKNEKTSSKADFHTQSARGRVHKWFSGNFVNLFDLAFNKSGGMGKSKQTAQQCKTKLTV